MHDVIVIGAGPAGLSAARALAERGRDVVVLEEHPAIGRPVHCTGLVGLSAFAELDLPRETIRATVRSARFHAGGRSVLFRAQRFEAAVVDRAAFDAALASGASAAGAAIRTNARVDAIDVDADGVAVRVGGDRQSFAARACVLACGANYRLQRRLGLGVPCAWAQSVQIDTASGARPHVDVHVGRDVAPSGFAWVVPFDAPTGPRARIGLMCDRGARERFRRFASSLGAAIHDAGAAAAARPRMLPLGPIRHTTAPRVIAVGDAAGLVKPTTGGGIYFALLTGRLAARVLDDALARDDLGGEALAEYRRRWQSRLGAEIRAGLAFRAVAARLDDRGIGALLRIGDSRAMRSLVERASVNWHRPAAMALLRAIDSAPTIRDTR